MNKKILALCLALVLVFPVAALAAKDTLRVGVAVDAKNLDPQNSVDTYSFSVIRQIYEPLFTVDGKTKELVPVLVDKWEMLDDVTYKFHLKQGVKFHNGEEMTAEDVVFSLQRIFDSIVAKSRGRYIDPDGFEIIDKYTLTMKTNGPVGGFLGSMKHPYASIMSRKAVTEAGKEYFRNPVGTGPYTFEKWVKGEAIDLARFDDYHGTKGNFKNMRFVVLPDSSSRMIALETGKIDMNYAVPYADFDRLVRENKVKVVEAPGLVLLHMGLNTQNPKLADPRVRQAIEYAVNKEAYNQVVYNGHAIVPKGPLPTVSQWFPADAKPWPYDPEKARILLKEAGVKDLKLSLWAINSQDRVDGATMIQGMLGQVGIAVEIRIIENAMFDDSLRQNKHDMYIGTGGMQTNRDAGVYWGAMFASTAIGATNKCNLNDPEVDKGISLAMATVDQAKRIPIFEKTFDRLNYLHPFVYLSHANEIYAGSKDLEGMDELYDGKVNYLGQMRFKE